MTDRTGVAGHGPNVDHLVFTSADVDEGVRRLEDLLGVAASPGGRHEGRGTRNALIGLGPRSYLEIVGVDPDQPHPAGRRWFGLDEPADARLATWATPNRRLDEVVRRAGALGVDLGAVSAADRRRPDGSELSWVFTDPLAERLGGVVPFFIDWGGSPHPAEGLPATCSLLSLVAEHPDAERLAVVLRDLDVALTVTIGPEPALIARVRSPKGVIELR